MVSPHIWLFYWSAYLFIVRRMFLRRSCEVLSVTVFCRRKAKLLVWGGVEPSSMTIKDKYSMLVTELLNDVSVVLSLSLSFVFQIIMLKVPLRMSTLKFNDTDFYVHRIMSM